MLTFPPRILSGNGSATADRARSLAPNRSEPPNDTPPEVAENLSGGLRRRPRPSVAGSLRGLGGLRPFLCYGRYCAWTQYCGRSPDTPGGARSPGPSEVGGAVPHGRCRPAQLLPVHGRDLA